MASEPAEPTTRQDPVEQAVELASEAVHAQWMETKRAQGVIARRSETGEELMVPYAELSEAAKDLDRGSVRATVTALAEAGLLADPARVVAADAYRSVVAALKGKEAALEEIESALGVKLATGEPYSRLADLIRERLADPAQTTELEQLRLLNRRMQRQVDRLPWRQRDYERARLELRKLNDAMTRKNRVTAKREAERDLALWLHAEAAWRVAGFDRLTVKLAQINKQVTSERDQAVAALHQLRHRVGELEAQIHGANRSLDVGAGRLNEARAERDERQARIDRALALHVDAMQNGGRGLPQPILLALTGARRG